MSVGFFFPLQLNEFGQVILCDGDDLTFSHLHSLVTTYKRERIMNMEYGVNSRLFDKNQPALILLEIDQAIKSELPALVYKSSFRSGENGELIINIIFEGEDEEQIFEQQIL